MIIRRITVADLDDVMVGAYRMHQEGVHRHMTFDASKVLHVFTQSIAGQTWATFVARRDDDNRLIGAILGYCMEASFSRELIAGEVGVYVLPEMRGGLAAARLVKAFSEWAIERGAREITLGVTIGISDAADRLYPRLGFERMGGLYMRLIDAQAPPTAPPKECPF